MRSKSSESLDPVFKAIVFLPNYVNDPFEFLFEFSPASIQVWGDMFKDEIKMMISIAKGTFRSCLLL